MTSETLYELRTAMTEAIEDVIARLDAGMFDTVTFACDCGKSQHLATDGHCGNCGKKIDRVTTNNPA